MSPLNPYFLQGSTSEQRLVQDLINEQLKMFGQDVVYLPRSIVAEKTIIKEVILSKFDDSFRIEAYVSNFNGFGGQGDILSKFGVRSTDELTLIISKERYEDFISPFLLTQDDIKVSTEWNKLFVECKKVEEEDEIVEYVQRGIARRAFTWSRTLSDDVEITDVNFDNGMLIIKLRRVIPDHQKKKTYSLN